MIEKRKSQRDRGLHSIRKWGIILVFATRERTSEDKSMPTMINNVDKGMDNRPTVIACDCSVPHNMRMLQSEKKYTLAAREMLEAETATSSRQIAEIRMRKIQNCVDCVPYAGHRVRRGPGFYKPPEIEMRAVEPEPLQRESVEHPVNAAKGGMSH